MRNTRKIVLTATPETINYTALVTAICEKIKNGGELIKCDNVADIKTTLHAAEKELS